MTSSVRERTEPAPPGPDTSETSRRGPSAMGRTITVITVVALVVCGIVLWATPVLGLRTVAVVGTGASETPHASDVAVSAAVANEVRAAVAVPSGTPLARIDVDSVRRRVMAVAAVAAAQVVRNWPHTLTVMVTERIAVATTQANGHWWYVDATGMPFRQLGGKPGNLVPLELATPGAGDRATLAAIGVVGSLSAQVRAQVVGVSAATAYDVRLLLTNGRSVIWGSDSDAAAKNAVIPALLREPGVVFDVSDPTLVTVQGH
ncbi:MAG: FtsQ-type POTRA domain-containing protein [Nakamurella sp.]